MTNEFKKMETRTQTQQSMNHGLTNDLGCENSICSFSRDITRKLKLTDNFKLECISFVICLNFDVDINNLFFQVKTDGQTCGLIQYTPFHLRWNRCKIMATRVTCLNTGICYIYFFLSWLVSYSWKLSSSTVKTKNIKGKWNIARLLAV